ncbi:small multi-drug export protein [Alkalicella caledoniensis]|uniref:Small multi-drug export protein n=1 Tax=Alkalicella caledoniensis TaxID=2731377 RepID=A0A7G9W3Y5_ALKCA|nr:small multi-drug export protein [Alkalicella caledoniensis]QNO13397.1 small multi-drug export protein [Alkalicella caledoniensis]
MSWLIEFLTLEFKVLFISALPIIELRGAIPFGVSQSMSPIHATLLGIVGGVLPVPFILLMIRPVLDFLHARNIMRKAIYKLTYTTIKNKKKIQKYGFWGLILIVAIPLPGTGVWSGSLAAALLDLRIKRAIPAIFIGNLIAGLIVLTISYGASIGINILTQ